MSAKVKTPGRPARGHKGRQRKLSCPACGFICYASASAITTAGLPHVDVALAWSWRTSATSR
jgi:hypothetical protein